MPKSNDIAYLVLRERQSRDLAAESGDISVRLAHIHMADGYAARIVALSALVEHPPL